MPDIFCFGVQQREGDMQDMRLHIEMFHSGCCSDDRSDVVGFYLISVCGRVEVPNQQGPAARLCWYNHITAWILIGGVSVIIVHDVIINKK